MKNLVMTMLVAACAASCLLAVAPAHADWSLSTPAYDPDTDTQIVSSSGDANASAPLGSASELAATVGGSGSGGGFGHAEAKRNYVQWYVWTGSGDYTPFEYTQTDEATGSCSAIDEASVQASSNAPLTYSDEDDTSTSCMGLGRERPTITLRPRQ